MTNSYSHAQRELDILAATVPDAIITPFRDEILALTEKFGKSGQSGGSAPMTASAICQALEKLFNFETIAPLTGEDSEWNDVTGINNGVPMFQNNRLSSVFKNGKDGKPYYIDAVIYRGNIGGTFTGGADVRLNGKQIKRAFHIKSFPFKPKTFYVDVFDHRWKDKSETELDHSGDWWTHTIKDVSQLDAVYEYYDKE